MTFAFIRELLAPAEERGARLRAIVFLATPRQDNIRYQISHSNYHRAGTIFIHNKNRFSAQNFARRPPPSKVTNSNCGKVAICINQKRIKRVRNIHARTAWIPGFLSARTSYFRVIVQHARKQFHILASARAENDRQPPELVN